MNSASRFIARAIFGVLLMNTAILTYLVVEFGTLTTFAISLILVLQSVSIFTITLALVHYREFWQP